MNYRLASSAFGLRTIAVLMLVFTTVLGTATSVAASGQAQTSVFIWTYENDQVVYDACYILVDYRDVACDDNGNGYVFFSQVPSGTYTVRQVADLGPNRHVEDFTIEVTGIGDPGAPYPGMEMFSTNVISTPGSSGSVGATQETWGATVQVNLCDAPPGSGGAMNCQAGAGVTVNISLASGEWLGSCTTGEPVATPWDTFISLCTVEGMPFNADLVATQDPATISPGYVPSEETLTLHVVDLVPGGGDQATFTFFNVPGGTGASTSNSSEPVASSGAADPMALLPSVADVPGGLIETGRRTRPLPEVAENYTDAAETTQLFTGWGWQGNAVVSFALPAGQQAQSGQVNGVYVSIHQFAGPDEARAALDFSLTEQAAGTVLQEVPVSPLGEHTRALYGPMDYGNEITILVQQGSFFIRVSAAMLDGDPTADALAVTEAILQKVTSGSTAGSASSSTSGSVITSDTSSGSGTGGLTVQFWDVRNNVPDNTSQCVQLVGATEVLCANDFPDGQIQINGIPAGTYEVCVTRFYPDVPGEPVWAWFGSPASVTIAPGSQEAFTLDLYMDFEPGDPTLCGFDPQISGANGSASSDTSVCPISQAAPTAAFTRLE